MAYGIRICCLVHAEGSTIVNGRKWRWEFHNYLGPTFLDRKGESIASPPENHPVWKEFNAWLWNYFILTKQKDRLERMRTWYKP